MGEPSPQYIWYKDGEEIIPADENVEVSWIVATFKNFSVHISNLNS